ncbi:hypothetical protein N9B72_02240, partial [Bacteriovoracaceae bacterium]|nr:hypothetical protein [Bacteriovoracaceae bacterium]
VEDKSARNWEFFNSLPISFSKKSVMRIAVPFIIILISGLANSDTSLSYHFISGGLLANLVTASLLTFASIISVSMGSYILVGMGLQLLLGVLSFIPYVSILAVVLLLALSVLVLSKYRLDNAKYLSIAGAVAIVLMIMAAVTRTFFLNSYMNTGDLRTSIFSAKILLNDKNSNQKAKIILSDKLFDNPDSWTVNMVLDSFSDADVALPVDEHKWKLLLKNNPNKREDLLSYLKSKYQQYTWLNHRALFDVEDMILADSNKCVNACDDLAELVSKGETSIVWERVKGYLVSSSAQKNIYGLKVLKYSGQAKHKKLVLALLNSDSERTRDAAVKMLSNWIKSENKDNLETLIDNMESSTTSKSIEELRLFFEKTI